MVLSHLNTELAGLQQQEPALGPAESELLLLPAASTALTAQSTGTNPRRPANGLPDLSSTRPPQVQYRTTLLGSHLPQTSGTSLTSRRCQLHCASPRSGRCEFHLTQATRPRCQVCQGRMMGPESPSPGGPNTTAVAGVSSRPPQSPPGSLGSEWPAHLEQLPGSWT